MNFSFIRDRRSFSDFIFILWAGGAALLSYSLVYALRKPFTAATFAVRRLGLNRFDAERHLPARRLLQRSYSLSVLFRVLTIWLQTPLTG